ncbi:MAG: 16S rRNA (uracil(1498)-N(3))-methyltransferase, partial [Phycisphaerales bacterium]|nr:16S rRNA (uracil(1498)-N(3))-methyltransferase [Phycisphaerales bacterium]
MRVPRFYLPVPLKAGTRVSLEGGAFNHAVRVLRLKPGAPLILFDGEGGACTATLGEIHGREATVQVMEVLAAQLEPSLPIVLAQGISRGEKMDHTVQKAVELGVNIFQPLFTERGGVRLNDERLTRKVQHWREIVINACEQCGRNRLPELREPLTLAAWLASPMVPGSCLLLDPLAE